MSSWMRPFERYYLLIRAWVEVEAKSPLRIGKGRSFLVGEADLPVIKDSRDRPFIPGSSLKGFVRAALSRYIATVNPKKAEEIVSAMFGFAGEEEGEEKQSRGSALLFGDLVPKDGAVVVVRRHIKIDPEKGGVEHLFEIEAVQEGAVFVGRPGPEGEAVLPAVVGRNISPALFSSLYAVEIMAREGLIRLGGFKSRGYGLVKVRIPQMEFILPGVDQETLRNGIELDMPINTGELVRLKLDGDKLEISEGGCRAEARSNLSEAPEYMGVKLRFKAEPILQSLFRRFSEWLLEGRPAE